MSTFLLYFFKPEAWLICMQFDIYFVCHINTHAYMISVTVVCSKGQGK